MNSKFLNGRARVKTAIAGAIAVGAVMALPGSASAANVECSGKIVPASDSNGRAFGYSFVCGSPEGDATQVDAYSIISNRPVSSFSTEVLVVKEGTPLNTESFACEGPFPGEGFGCFGKASLYNTIEGGFQLLRNPCSNKARRKGTWHVWVVASASKINPVTGAKTPATSEPLRLRVPACGTTSDSGKGGK